MSHGYGHPESQGRRRAMLRTAMGPEIAAALADPAVIEVMVNPDGALRLDRLGDGRTDTGEPGEASGPQDGLLGNLAALDRVPA